MHLSQSFVIYTATVLGALALLMLTPRKRNPFKIAGAGLGAVTLGWFWIYFHSILISQSFTDEAGRAMIFYYIFSALAIMSAVRVITHQRPVYSALWFVMVVLSTSGLLLVLGAEFMAFAMAIIYGGAILVTYVFVIMLAAQSGDPGQENASPETTGPAEYDAVAREPLFAVAAGFLLLAVLLTASFSPMLKDERAAGPTDRQLIIGTKMTGPILSHRPGLLVEAQINKSLSASSPNANPAVNDVPPQLASSYQLDNVERVGLDLFRSHPLGLELAGIILLVSLIGAVVIARKRVESEKTPAV